MTPPAPAVPALSVIIVTWNCRALAVRCLATLLAAELPPGTEVILVDNASADGTAAAVAEAFPTVQVLANDRNEGFAAANNQALALARGRHALLLNPDAFPLAPDSLMALWRLLEGDPTIAIVGPRLVHADGRHQVGDAGWRPGFGSLALHALGLGNLAPRWLRGVYLVRPDALGRGPVAVDWICGACLMVRLAAVAQAGPLDTRWFMYAEDVEWGCRMRAAGFGVAYLSGTRVLHLQGGTQAGPPSALWLDNLVGLHCRLNGSASLPPLRLVLAFGFGLRALLYALAARLRPARREELDRRAAAMAAFARQARRLVAPSEGVG